MNRNLKWFVLVPAIISGLAAGCSAAPAARPDARTAAAATQPCPGQSLSRIKGACPTGPARAYSQQDIERTGQTNVGDALQMLDPSITVHH